MKNLVKLSVLVLGVAAVLVGCGAKDGQPNVELIQDMMVQDAVKAQRYDDFTESGISARVPPEGTIPIGGYRYRYANDIEGAIKNLKNPMAGSNDPEVLLTGQNFYNTNCMICHGTKGAGDGTIKKLYPLPIPSLLSAKIRNWNDANIYHVLTMGQGTMGPYGSHIPEKYRWQVVQYIRHLQNEGK